MERKGARMYTGGSGVMIQNIWRTSGWDKNSVGNYGPKHQVGIMMVLGVMSKTSGGHLIGIKTMW